MIWGKAEITCEGAFDLHSGTIVGEVVGIPLLYMDFDNVLRIRGRVNCEVAFALHFRREDMCVFFCILNMPSRVPSFLPNIAWANHMDGICGERLSVWGRSGHTTICRKYSVRKAAPVKPKCQLRHYFSLLPPHGLRRTCAIQIVIEQMRLQQIPSRYGVVLLPQPNEQGAGGGGGQCTLANSPYAMFPSLLPQVENAVDAKTGCSS